MKSNIYTKTGDKGKTSLIGGTRVSKGDDRLDAYGTVDECNSIIGMIRSFPLDADDKAFLIFVQGKLFVAGGYLATDQSVSKLKKNTTITDADIAAIEKEIDKLDAALPPLQTFVLPGGDPQVSACHMARTVCRRAERLIVRLMETTELDPRVLLFFNRLSDYLFVLSRKVSIKNDCEEIPWLPS